VTSRDDVCPWLDVIDGAVIVEVMFMEWAAVKQKKRMKLVGCVAVWAVFGLIVLDLGVRR